MRGQSGRCGIHLGIGDGRGDGCDGHLPSRSRDKQFHEEFKSEFRLPQRECELHLGCDSSESFKGSRRDGDSGILQMTQMGRCWAWKHRNLMSNPKRDVADPVTATDYKDPDLVGYEE